MIFSLRQDVPFSSSCFISAFSRGYYRPSFELSSKKRTPFEMTSTVRLSLLMLSLLSSLATGSYLKKAFTSFITIFYYS